MKVGGKGFYKNRKSDKSEDDGRDSCNQIDERKEYGCHLFRKVIVQKAGTGNAEDECEDNCDHT